MTEQTRDLSEFPPADEERRAAHLILLVEDGRPAASGPRQSLEKAECVLLQRTGQTRRKTHDVGPVTLHIKLADESVSREHARLSRTSDGRWQVEDLGSSNGTCLLGWSAGRPLPPRTLAKGRPHPLVDGDVIEVGSSFLLFRANGQVLSGETPVTLETGTPDVRLETFADCMREELENAERFARLDTILLIGESGTGKELFARAIHLLSARPGKLVSLNCARLERGTADSALFGHQQGSFTGATRSHRGAFERAHEGTLFLDEIGEMVADVQAMLLRALQERSFHRLGSEKELKVDVQVVCASHRSLRGEVEAGGFGRPLYHRIRQAEIVVPPLRDRLDDVGLLISSLLRRQLGDAALGVRLERYAVRALLRHDWPGNVRELQGALVTAVSRTEPRPGGKVAVRLKQLPPEIATIDSQSAGAQPFPSPSSERDDLLALLERHKGALSDAAQALEISHHELRRRCIAVGIEPDAVLRAHLQRLLGEHGGSESRVAQVYGKHRQQIQKWRKRLSI